MSFYAVQRGRQCGVFSTWTNCEASVKGFPNARYKKFKTDKEAQDFVAKPASDEPVTIIQSKAKKRKIDNLTLTSAKSPSIVAPLEATAQQSSSTEPSCVTFMHDARCLGRIIVYTDGSAISTSDGPRAGYGIYWGKNHSWNVAARCVGVQKNNRAELTAVTQAIIRAKAEGLTMLLICTDSKFVISCVQDWGPKWMSNGWKLSTGGDVQVRSEVEALLRELDDDISVTFRHVKGHSGIVGNDAADKLANYGATLPL